LDILHQHQLGICVMIRSKPPLGVHQMFNAQAIDTFRRDEFSLLRAQWTKHIEFARDLNVLTFRTDSQITPAYNSFVNEDWINSIWVSGKRITSR